MCQPWAGVDVRNARVEESIAREVLSAARAATFARMRTLRAELEEIMTATQGANADDEHDPEGSTIAFERAQLAGLLDEARRTLVDLDQALARLADGTYALCEGCGARIDPERLGALPATRTCVRCAARGWRPLD
jgi:DnaK suppressor protein